MTLLGRVRGVPGIGLLHCRLLAGATGLAAVGMVLLGKALADPPAPRTPPTADAPVQQVFVMPGAVQPGAVQPGAVQPGAAVAKTARVAPRLVPHNPPAGKCFVIQAKFLRADGSELMGPRVSVVDGQTASIKNGSERPFVTRLTKTPDGETQPNIEFLDEGVNIKLKAVGDTDGLINVDATVELSRVASVGTRTIAKTSRQSPRQRTQTVRAIESVQLGEKIAIALQDARPPKPGPTTLQALANAALGRLPPAEEPIVTAVEITVQEVKTAPGDAAISPLIHPPAAAPSPTSPAAATLRSGK